MKQGSKFISIVLASTLILSSTVFGATGVNRITFTRNILDANGISVDSAATSVFTDVEGEDGAYLAAAKDANIVSGYEDSTFKPNDAITMEQAVIIALNGKGLQAQVNALTDEEIVTILGDKAGDVSNWAKKYMAFAVSNNVIDLGTLQTKDMVTEDQATAMIETASKIKVTEVKATEAVAEKPVAVTEAAVEDQTGADTTPATEESAKADLSATDMLLNSSKISAAQSTYKMSGTTNVTQKIDVGTETVNTTSVAKIEASYETPDKMYMNISTTSEMPGQTKPISVPMEMYMNGKTLYLKGEGISEDWTKLDTSQMDIASLTSSNSVLTVEQINELSKDISFGKDKVVDGKTLRAINVTISPEAFQKIMASTYESMSSSMEALMESIMLQSGTTLTAEEKTAVADLLDQAFKNMTVSGQYTYYIDEETMLPVQIDTAITLHMPLTFMGETMSIDSDTTGSLKLYDYGTEITFPVVE